MENNTIEYEKNIIKQCLKDKQALLYCLERLKEDVFEDEIYKFFYKIFLTIIREGHNITRNAVLDVLRFSDNKDIIPLFENLVEEKGSEEEEWKYNVYFILENYSKRKLLQVSKYINLFIGKESAEEILNNVNFNLNIIQSNAINNKSFDTSMDKTLEEIRQIDRGEKKSYYKTGWNEFDKIVSLTGQKFILLAAQKKIGKSRFTIDTIDRLIQNNNNELAILWFSFEMLSSEIIRCFLSKKTNISDYQLMSKNYKLTDKDKAKIEAAKEETKEYPIDFVDSPVNIFTLCSKFEVFCNQFKDKQAICIIDNIGLIKPHITESVAYEDDISRMLKGLRDKTGGIIIAIHHLSKESENKWNKDSGYEPKLSHIRGSSRLVDFANQVLLLHRPDNYSDLIEINPALKGSFIVNCAANREGETKEIIMKHQLEFCKFEE